MKKKSKIYSLYSLVRFSIMSQMCTLFILPLQIISSLDTFKCKCGKTNAQGMFMRTCTEITSRHGGLFCHRRFLLLFHFLIALKLSNL